MTTNLMGWNIIQRCWHCHRKQHSIGGLMITTLTHHYHHQQPYYASSIVFILTSLIELYKYNKTWNVWSCLIMKRKENFTDAAVTITTRGTATTVGSSRQRMPRCSCFNYKKVKLTQLHWFKQNNSHYSVSKNNNMNLCNAITINNNYYL